jgi:hypothetical protein
METNQALQTMDAEADIKTMVGRVRDRLAAVRELLKSELKGPTDQNPEGTDYGVIPGTKKKTLLQPGAEKIALMFQFAPSYTITRDNLPGGHREVTAVCTLTHSGTGRIVGQCAGSASTMESKHRYRGAAGKTCPECGAVACKPSKKEYGGGYYCESKSGGCGKKIKPGTPECKALDDQATVKTENPDPADQWNTVDKIAQKRAYVGAVKGATAASELFTVDLEDAEREREEPQRAPIAQPQPKAAQPTPTPSPAPAAIATGQAEANTGTVRGLVEDIAQDTAANGSIKYGVKLTGDDRRFGTFSGTLGEAALCYKSEGIVCDAVVKSRTVNSRGKDKTYWDLVALTPIEADGTQAGNTEELPIKDSEGELYASRD